MGTIQFPHPKVVGDQEADTLEWCQALEWPIEARLHTGFTMVPDGDTVTVECFRMTDDELADALKGVGKQRAKEPPVRGDEFVRAEVEDRLARAKAALVEAEAGAAYVDAVAADEDGAASDAAAFFADSVIRLGGRISPDQEDELKKVAAQAKFIDEVRSIAAKDARKAAVAHRASVVPAAEALVARLEAELASL